MNERGTWDRLLDALSDRYRRQLMVALLEHNPQRDDDVNPMDLASQRLADADRLMVEMQHRHLPKLAEMGYISWDQANGEIRRGPCWEEIQPVLRLLHEHRERLPDGWL